MLPIFSPTTAHLFFNSELYLKQKLNPVIVHHEEPLLFCVD